MRSSGNTILCLFVLGAIALAQTRSTEHNSFSKEKPDLERGAIINLRKLAIGESVYAMSHPQEGFACDTQTLTTIDWPDSPNHAKLLEPALVRAEGKYKLSAKCSGSSKPAGTLNIFAIPLDPNAGLRAFCATGTFGAFETLPYVRTSEFPIRSTFAASAESCLVSGKPLK